ncbi:MAG: phage Gp37/Gp68 family protein [Chloroflexi bacterium]|nr:phage Gp37/Gp68 family protein [Chloroflexota bacterium]
MGTQIEWTEETWNPVVGCSKVSHGCDNCYMFAMFDRLRAMGVKGYEGAPDQVVLRPERLVQPLKWKSPKTVFVNSMSDLFHRDVPFEYITEIFEVMIESAISIGHIFQILTKRPGRAVAWWSEFGEHFGHSWHPNIWIGTSVESQKYVPRIDVLARVPAPIKFLSAEPLLGPLTLLPQLEAGMLDWVIVGGESGRGARPMDPDWPREIRAQCQTAEIPFFFKQWGAHNEHLNRVGKRTAGRLLDGQTWSEMPTRQPVFV